MIESCGFIRHAAMMLEKASVHIKEEWEEGEIMMAPVRVLEMRRELANIKRLLKDIEPYMQQFENVSKARVVEHV